MITDRFDRCGHGCSKFFLLCFRRCDRICQRPVVKFTSRVIDLEGKGGRVLAENSDFDLNMDPNMKRPGPFCIFCQKSIDDVGGRRLVGTTKGHGYGVYDRPIGGGSKDRPFRSIQFPGAESKYLVVWGLQWTAENMQQALKMIQDNKLPWFCQKCGHRQCSGCGEPINYPVASDVIYDDGHISHCPIIPADMGCINPNCEKYKDLHLF